jgi:Holliday junction resolvase RusA-like endonuclease
MWAEFAVPGTPRPEGSTRYMGHRGGKPLILHDDPELDTWRDAVTRIASVARKGRRTLVGAVSVEYVFVVPAPKTRRNPEAITARDLDKLVRGVNDALERAGVFKNDAQVVEIKARKRWPEPGEQTGVIVRIEALQPEREVEQEPLFSDRAWATASTVAERAVSGYLPASTESGGRS